MNVKMCGKSFEVEPGEHADFWGWINSGRYDAELYLLRDVLKPEDTFIDLGAWIGSHSLLASTICKRVIAVEPDPVAHSELRQNIAGHQNIEFVRSAISGHTGHIKLGSSWLGHSTTRANPAPGPLGPSGGWAPEHTFETACITFPQLLEQRAVEPPFFVKMDIEGSEEQVLASDWWDEHHPRLYMEIHPGWWADSSAMWTRIEQLKRVYGKWERLPSGIYFGEH